jgi:DNA-binding response OmpR family regulator
MKLLVVEDDVKSRQLLKKFLVAKQYDVIEAADGAEALQQFEVETPDLVLLDVMMPKLDGWAVLERIRERSDVPVIMLTAKDTTEDKVRGLSSGVDDYITKPFDLLEVVARIEAVSRRYQSEPSPLIKVKDLEIDDEQKRVSVRGEAVELSPKEYDLLKLLASKPGKVFSHQEVLDVIWADSHFASSEDVKKYIYLLRNKIEHDAENPELVLTVRGFGYKLAT